jgi:hypothetical protein
MQRTVTFADLGASGKWSADALVGVKKIHFKAPQGTFPGEGLTGMKFRFEATGEYRAPKKGEYYLSGSEIVAYRAPNDFTLEFWIAAPALPRPVSVCSLCSQPWSAAHNCPKIRK